MRRSTFKSICCLFVLLFGLTGCWDRIEVNDLGVVIATAIDSAPKGVQMSVQVYVPSSDQGGGGGFGISGGGGGGAGKPYFVFTGIGKDLSEAGQNLQLKLSRRMFVSHRRVCIISEDLARKGLKPYIDELTRNPKSRLRVNVVVAKGRAIDLLKVEYPFELVPAEAMRKILFGDATNFFQLDLKDLMNMLATPDSNAMIPIVELQPPFPGSRPIFKMDGLAVFHNGRMIGKLSSFEARGVLWLRDQMSKSTVTVNIPGQKGQLSCDLRHIKTDFSVKMVKGHPQMHIRLMPESDLIENNTGLDMNNPKNVAIAEQAYSRDIKRNVEFALELLQHRFDSDILGFDERVRHADPKAWKTMKQSWSQEFSRMPVTVEVDGKIRRVGMTGASLTREDNEITK